MTYPGKFITFEGTEGSGKSTQIDRLYHHIISHPQISDRPSKVILTREPGGTPLGSEIRKLLLNTTDQSIAPTAELLLYAADRAQHVETVIKPALKDGAIVLCDRFTDSTLAYQCYGRGIDRHLVDKINYVATGRCATDPGIMPDLTLWLDIDVEAGLQRARGTGKGDRLESEAIDFHKRVHSGFQRLCFDYGDRFIRVDANGTVDEVWERVRAIVCDFLNI